MKPITPQSQRDYLISKGFKVGERGRFSSEMIQALKDSGLIFTKPIKDPKPRGVVEYTNLK
jgi:hypothetical protein